MNIDFEELQKKFIENYGESDQPIQRFFAPGRVNLLGEHTDYNGGLVFPCAIEFGTALLIRRRKDQLVKLSSLNFSFAASLLSNELRQKHGDQWVNYPLGVIDQFRQIDIKIDGVEMMYLGDIPNGAGLSSSASLEVVTAFAFNQLFDLRFEKVRLAKLAQAAENQFVGVNCGIMDQYASAMGQPHKAMKLDCQTLDCEQVPVELGEYSLVIANSNQRRELGETGYNERFAQSREVLSLLQRVYSIESLAQLNMEQLDKEKSNLPNLLYRRAKHVVTENSRVEKAVEELRGDNLQAFAQLMNESHTSMRDDYEVSSSCIDVLVESAQTHQGVLGARLTGGGFGGCTINLVRTDLIDDFRQSVAENYQKKTGLCVDFYPVKLEQGVHEVQV